MGREFADTILGLFWVAVTHLCLLQVDADWQETPIPAAVMGQKIQLVGSACKDTLPRSIRRKVVIRYFVSILLAAEKRFDFFHVLGIARGNHLAHLDNPMPHHAAIDVFIVELSQIIREPLVISCEKTEEAGLPSALSASETKHHIELAPWLKDACHSTQHE